MEPGGLQAFTGWQRHSPVHLSANLSILARLHDGLDEHRPSELGDPLG